MRRASAVNSRALQARRIVTTMIARVRSRDAQPFAFSLFCFFSFLFTYDLCDIALVARQHRVVRIPKNAPRSTTTYAYKGNDTVESVAQSEFAIKSDDRTRGLKCREMSTESVSSQIDLPLLNQIATG